MIKKETSEKIAQMGFICAIMVVYIHVMLLNGAAFNSLAWWVWAIFPSGIFAIAVPFFFVVSGYFLAFHMNDARWWRTALRKRALSLLVPYVFWSAVVTGFVFAVFALLPPSMLNSVAVPGGVPRWRHFPSIRDLLWNPPLYPFWYIRLLLCLVVASPLIKWLLARLGVTLIVGLFACCLAVDGFSASLPKGAVTFLVTTFPIRGILYFTVGVWLQRRQRAFDVSRSTAVVALVLGIGAFVLRPIALCFGLQELAGCCMTFAIPFSLVGLFCLCPVLRLSKELRRMSFPIFVLHTPVLFCLEVCCLGLLRLPMTNSVVSFVFEGALACAISVALAVPVRRFTPWSFGGR